MLRLACYSIPSLSHPRQRIAIRMAVPTVVPHSGSPNPPQNMLTMLSLYRRHLDHKCSMKGSLGRTCQTSAPAPMPISQRSRTKQNIGPLQLSRMRTVGLTTHLDRLHHNVIWTSMYMNRGTIAITGTQTCFSDQSTHACSVGQTEQG